MNRKEFCIDTRRDFDRELPYMIMRNPFSQTSFEVKLNSIFI